MGPVFDSASDRIQEPVESEQRVCNTISGKRPIKFWQGLIKKGLEDFLGANLVSEPQTYSYYEEVNNHCTDYILQKGKTSRAAHGPV